MCGSPEYRTLKQIHGRCFNPNGTGFHRYGGRGITVCQRWRGKDGPTHFLADMGKKPSARHSIDRIDNDGHYSCGKCPQCRKNGWPPNCRWALPKEQGRNRIDNRRITIGGSTRTVTEWSEASGTAFSTIANRLERGWSPRDAVFQPAALSQPRGHGSVYFNTLERKWKAHINHKKVRYNLGTFATREQAEAALATFRERLDRGEVG
jgi:hypothetical protein